MDHVRRLLMADVLSCRRLACCHDGDRRTDGHPFATLVAT
jgi:hypothetical protein